jgi:hypothetical protein
MIQKRMQGFSCFNKILFILDTIDQKTCQYKDFWVLKLWNFLFWEIDHLCQKIRFVWSAFFDVLDYFLDTHYWSVSVKLRICLHLWWALRFKLNDRWFCAEWLWIVIDHLIFKALGSVRLETVSQGTPTLLGRRPAFQSVSVGRIHPWQGRAIPIYCK